MMTWWGERGIDGFRMDVITMISKDQRFPDGVVHGNENSGIFLLMSTMVRVCMSI